MRVDPFGVKIPDNGAAFSTLQGSGHGRAGIGAKKVTSAFFLTLRPWLIVPAVSAVTALSRIRPLTPTIFVLVLSI